MGNRNFTFKYVFSFYQRHFPGILIIYMLAGCSKDPAIIVPDQDYKLNIPSNFPQAQLPPSNPMRKAVVELGRQLFFDSLLSGDNKLSCASCHSKASAFADSTAFSLGSAGKLTKRNTMPLFNLLWNTSFFWDGGVHDLESQAIVPITSVDEMNENFPNLIAELQATPEYPLLFKKAFGSDMITGQEILAALAQFERTLISGNSQYDKYIRGDKNALSSTASMGLAVYRKNCASCHTEGLFTDNQFHNNGLDSTFPDFTVFDNPLLGRGRITSRQEDVGKYRTPSLRNAASTGPYMHDGRFSTLEEVLAHYNNGIATSSSLDSAFIHATRIGIDMTDTEMLEIIEFIKSLTDDSYILIQ